MAKTTCRACDGTGTINGRTCQVCDGTGEVEQATREERRALGKGHQKKDKK